MVGLLRASSVTSFHGDINNSGVDSTETTLTPSNVNTTSFSKRFATTVDGKIYAQPLYMPNVNVVSGPNAGVHNLVFVATEHDTLFAIDAQSGAIVWQTSFTASGLAGAVITSVPSGDTNSTDTSPEIGVTSTPVIDPSTNCLYCTAKTKQTISGVNHYVYTLYKIDITNGNATPNANIVASTMIGNTIYNTVTSAFTYNTATSPTAAQDPFVVGTGDGAITVNGQSRVYFNTLRQMQRPGLRLYNGTLYIAFASHGDNGPYHGWLLAYNAATLTITGALNTTPNAGLGGFWGGGAAPVIDSNGYIYLTTGNGQFDGYSNNGSTAGLNSSGFPVNGDYGDSFLKIAVDSTTSPGNQNINGWGLKVVDYFSPYNSAALDNTDTDLGSGGIVLLPPSAGSSAHPNLLVGAGKQGNVYLVDTANMGKFSATTDNVVQEQVAIGESFTTPCFFNGVLYYAGVTDNLKAFTVSNAQMSTSPIESVDGFYWPGATLAISANGTSSGIIWGIDSGSQALRAYQVGNIGTELWTSLQAANNADTIGTTQKFAAPAVADGQVFCPTATALVVYGPPPGSTSTPAAPSNLAGTAVSGLQINLSWTDNSSNENGFSIEQSSDGQNFAQVGTVGANVTTYSAETNIAAGMTYYFRVRAFNGSNNATYSSYSNVATVATPGYPPSLDFSSGFAGSTGTLTYNGNAQTLNSSAELTDGGTNEAGTVFSSTAQNIGNFTTTFTFQESSASADGFTFIIQNAGNTAVGANGSGLGYAGISNSIAVKFDIFNDAGEGSDSTGLYTNGATPTVPATDLTSSGITLGNGDVMSATLSYDGTTLTETITDTVTNATVTESYTVNIPSIIGSSTAYVGFGGSTSSATAVQNILTWTFAPLPTSAPAAPSNLTAAAASGTSINLSWTSNSTNQAGFIIMRATGNGSYTQVGVTGANTTSYSDSGLIPNTTYSYKVAATNNIGNSPYSNVASALVPIAPATPTNAQPTAITSTSISMSWTNNATNATGYHILRKMTTASNFSQIATLPANATTYTDTGLSPGTSYDYHIQAFNVAGYSDFSGFTAVTLVSGSLPVVTISVPGPVAVNGIATGGITFTANVAPTSPLTVNYTVSGTGVAGADYAALSGSAVIPANSTTVTVPVTASSRATHNATVTVSIASSSNYTAGTPASGTVLLEGIAYNSTAQTAHGTSTVSDAKGTNVVLTFPGLTGNPSGAVYVWYFDGVALTTTTSGSYTITSPTELQTGTYSVYAWAPGGVTGSESYNVTIPPSKTGRAVQLVGSTPQTFLSASGARIGFEVASEGLATTAYIQYGTSTSYGNVTATMRITASSLPAHLLVLLSGLQSGTTYDYQIVTQSSAGTVVSANQTFTTLPFDTELVAAAATSDALLGGANFNFASFGNPVVNDSGNTAFRGVLKLGSGVTAANDVGIWAGNGSGQLQAVAQTGSANDAPGASAPFTALDDPVYNNNNAVAFVGTLKVGTGLATIYNDLGVWSNSSGNLSLVARKGFQAPDYPTGATFATFAQIALPDVNGVILLATVNVNAALGVTAASNTGIWAVDGSNNLHLIVRTGQVINGKTVTALSFMSALAPVSGQSRSFSSGSGEVTFLATFNDHTTAIFDASSAATIAPVASTHSSAPGPSGATFASFGYPAINVNGNNAFRGVLALGSSVTALNDQGIWADNSPNSLQLVAQTGSGSAPGTTAPFTALSDPVYNDNNDVAFVGTLKVGTGLATLAEDKGIWSNAGGNLMLVAQTGTQAPGCPTGATFSGFTQVALPNQNGVVMLATLTADAALGVTAYTDRGIWATDSTGNLQLIVRTGDVLDGKTVTGLAFLPAVATVTGQSRSFSSDGGSIAYLVTFSDRTTGIFSVTFP